MNYDRLRTRVFDTQEKRMIYKHKAFIYDKVIYAFEAATNDAIIASKYDSKLNVCQIICLELEDRFVPMQCLGNTDKNKKLIYSADIVATSNNKYLVYREEESAAFWFKRLDNECELLIDDFSCEIEIIGNRWENEKLMEVKA